MTERYAIDLTAVALFHAVANLGSLSLAAEAVGLTQPSASAKLRKLERQLGVRLIDRSHSGSTVSGAGRSLLNSTQELLEAADCVHSGAAALRQAHDNSLRLVSSYSIAEYLLPTWIAAFGLKRQELRTEIDVANSNRVVPRVLSGDAHLGFVEGPDIPTQLQSAVVAHDELVVVTAADSGFPAELTAQQLAKLHLVTRETGSGTRAAFEHALRGAGLGPPASPAAEASSTSAVKATVMNSNGVAVLSRLTVDLELRAGLLREIGVHDLDLRRELRVCWHPTQLRSVIAQEFLGFVRNPTQPNTTL